MRTSLKDHIVEAHITHFSKEGFGLGTFVRPNGMTSSIEVPFTLPSEIVKAKIQTKRYGRFSASLEEVVVSASDRTTARCVHFGICGGCRWQHIQYQRQLEIKQSFISDCFKSLLSPTVIFNPIIPCADPWNYRNKMEFTFWENKQGKKALGLNGSRTKNRVFDLLECPISSSWFADAAIAVRKWWDTSDIQAYYPPGNSGTLRTLTLRDGKRTGERLVILNVSGHPDFSIKKAQIESFVEALKAGVTPPNGHLSIVLRIQQIAKGMATNFYEMHLFGPDCIHENISIELENITSPVLNFKISPTAFFQPNTVQAEKLYSAALKLLEASKDDVVYDLYCGTGTIGISLAQHVKEVIGIEISPESALDAQENVKINNLGNVTILSGAVRHVLNQINDKNNHPKPTIVIVDPPRAGLDEEAISQLKELQPAKILYISCNPSTQALNVEELMKAGYSLKAIQPVDLFPHTVHVENIVILHRN